MVSFHKFLKNRMNIYNLYKYGVNKSNFNSLNKVIIKKLLYLSIRRKRR
jgi:hypothetical protein